MRTLRVNSSRDAGVSLHVEDVGSGPAILFLHEFAGDHRSWDPQVRHFARRFRCITYAARGYPPSSVPTSLSAYSQQQAVEDALDIMDALGLGKSHLVGLSMGGFCALHVALQAPDRVASVSISGVGYGSVEEAREPFRAECEAIAVAFETEGADNVAKRYAVGPARVQFQNKDPVGHAEFEKRLGEHSSLGSALTMRGFQKERPSLFNFAEQLAAMTVPLLILVGDEDEGAIDTSVSLKRIVPSAGLVVLPKSGHTLNLEEPVLFNGALDRFLLSVMTDSWGTRDPRSQSSSTTGMR
jgi:pimeloyl-ACP methyl ester carboxylesterase